MRERFVTQITRTVLSLNRHRVYFSSSSKISFLLVLAHLWTDAGKARDALRLTTRIYHYRVQQSASEAVSQAVNGCAAQHSRQLLTFRAKTCSPFPPITTICCRRFLRPPAVSLSPYATSPQPPHPHPPSPRL